MLKQDEPDYTRIFLAVFLSAVLLIFWQVKVEWPRRQQLAQFTQEQKKAEKVKAESSASKIGKAQDAEENQNLTREQRIAASARVAVRTDKVTGSIALKGARFDDISLVQYRETIEKDSAAVTLFSPNGDAHGFFAHIGWLSPDSSVKVPTQDTVWHADRKEIGVNQPVTLSWNNGAGLTFHLKVTLDEHYMFAIAQRVENDGGHPITLMPYAYLNRTYELPKTAPFLHEGPLGVMNDSLNEVSYKDLKDKGTVAYEDATGWFGMADHYWLAALIPSGDHHKITFGYYQKGSRDRYQVDYIDEPVQVAPGASIEGSVRLFAGAKELTLLDHYADGGKNVGEPIHLFDRALDFGAFYFLAKPATLTTYYLYKSTGNFGVALLIFVMLLKVLMYPLASKSYKSMAQMRELQPEMVKIREKYFDDQIAMHKAMRDLYKREKVNPAAGCLPVLLQIIIFLALFRGLNVMIEMRHAPFYGWIQDLSARDPSNIFTAFGLIPWTPPGFLHLGLLPVLYTITMVVQTRLQPTPPDPVQAKMIAYMPYFMLVFFASMPAGFVLYWTWSNILSILQQQMITKKHKKPGAAAAAANG